MNFASHINNAGLNLTPGKNISIFQFLFKLKFTPTSQKDQYRFIPFFNLACRTRGFWARVLYFSYTHLDPPSGVETMRYLTIIICLTALSACGGSDAPDEVLFQQQRSTLQKAQGVEDMLLDTDQKRRAQMEAQE